MFFRFFRHIGQQDVPAVWDERPMNSYAVQKRVATFCRKYLKETFGIPVKEYVCEFQQELGNPAKVIFRHKKTGAVIEVVRIIYDEDTGRVRVFGRHGGRLEY